MDTSFGLRGAITPPDALKDFAESFVSGPFHISLQNGIIEIGFENESLADAARSLIERYLDVSSFVRGRRLTTDLNQSWRKNTHGTRDISIALSETIKVHDDLQLTTTSVTITGKAFIVPAFDSRSLAQQNDLIAKCEKSPALTSALRYFNEEVVADDKPLYGVYKAIEALTQALCKKGRAKLGQLAGQTEKYVSDVMQTAQTTRHHADPDASQVLTEAECRERARILIEAYAKSI
jgi:hypothetical protein